MAAASARGKNEPPRPIIVKKVTIVAGGHHGGAWKVAYADFLTAMMAFFLLLLLLGATTEKQRKGIADYFTPTLIKTREASAGSNAGLLGGSSITEVGNYPNKAGQTGTRPPTIPRQVRMVDTTEGIRIDLVDDADFSMFRLGTTMLTGEAAQLLKAIGDVVRPEEGGILVRGHTDATPWRSGGGANNWSLSAGRAEATRQSLLNNGIGEDRFRRIEGVADRELLIKDHPEDPRNRRISILLVQ